MKPAVNTLLKSAVQAPSGDNVQPWRFVVDDDEATIEIHVDETRDRSPMNAGQRMSRIACGAALENIVRTAELNHWPVSVETGRTPAVATIQLLENVEGAGVIDKAITERHTNRQFYDGKPLEASQGKLLESAVSGGSGIGINWVTSRSTIGEFAKIIGDADAAMFGIGAMRQAFLENIRFDLRDDEPANEGLPLRALGLSWTDRIGLKMLRFMPDGLVKIGGVTRSFRKRAAGLIESAGGLCVITAQEDTDKGDVGVGRAFERAWLALTAAGLAVQPMMSLPVLDNWQSQECSASDRSRLSRNILDLTSRARSELKLAVDQRVAAVLRFGFAAEVGVRAKRRRLDTCVVAKRRVKVSR